MPANIWKILGKNSPGTASTFGADDWDMPGRYFNDVDLTATAPASIKTNTSFWDNRLRVWNPAKTKSYRIRGLAIVNDYDLTLPLLSSNDEIVGLITSQTLQNKIINVNNNTLKHGTTNAIGDLLVGTGTKYDRLAMGSTGGYVLAVKNDLTGLEWVSAPGGGGGGETNTASNVGTAGVGVFKQKSGVDLQFKKLNTASGGLVTVTDDTANNEIDLKITAGTDGQFLKTVGSTPTWSTLTGAARTMPDGSTYSGARYAAFQGGDQYGEGMWNGSTYSGTASSEMFTGTTRTVLTSAAVDTDKAGISAPMKNTRMAQSPRFKTRFITSTTTERYWVGFLDQDTYPGGANPLANRAGMMVGYGESDANFLIRWNNASASPQTYNTGIPKDTATHTIELFLNPTGTSVSAWWDTALVVNANTTQAPATTWDLSEHMMGEAVGATATTLKFEYAQMTFF
jgi:hypothetical protein